MSKTISILNESFINKYGKVSDKINESAQFPSLFKEVSKCLEKHGYDVESDTAKNYIWAVVDYIEMARNYTGEPYEVETWYSDTKMNYPEDFNELPRKMRESLTEAEDTQVNRIVTVPVDILIGSDENVDDVMREIDNLISNQTYQICNIVNWGDPQDVSQEYLKSGDPWAKAVLLGESLSEAEMSDEDKADSALLRNIYNKMQKRTNAALTPEEKAVMNKYGLKRSGKSILSKDDFSGKVIASPYVHDKTDAGIFNKYSHDIKPEVNLADRARKVDSRRPYTNSVRTQNTVYNPDTTSYHDKRTAFHPDTFQDLERVKQNNAMYEPVHDMKRALSDRKYHQKNADEVDARYQKIIDKAQRDRDWEKRYHTQGVDSAYRQINKLLKKEN